MSLRFHWSLSSAGEQRRGSKERRLQSGLPELQALRQYCEMAEECGIESLLTMVGGKVVYASGPFLSVKTPKKN